MLFTRYVSGTRVIPKNESKTLSGITLSGFGSSTTNYPHNYITTTCCLCCAIGLSEEEMEEFFKRLEKVLKEYKKKKEKDDELVDSMETMNINK